MTNTRPAQIGYAYFPASNPRAKSTELVCNRLFLEDPNWLRPGRVPSRNRGNPQWESVGQPPAQQAVRHHPPELGKLVRRTSGGPNLSPGAH